METTAENGDNLSIKKLDIFSVTSNKVHDENGSNQVKVDRHHVSCEDLLDFATDLKQAKPSYSQKEIDSDEVRIMQKVLSKDVS